jgi:signal transduction histidine kinase
MLENDLLEGLRTERQYIDDSEEADAVAAAEKEVDAYMKNVRLRDDIPGAPRLDRALGAVRRVADLNIAQARKAEIEAVRWNRLADQLGYGIALVVILGVPLTTIWLGVFAFRPILGIIVAMKRFASGEMDVRASRGRGMEELRRVADQFNDMADAIRRQRQNQLAFLAGVSHDLRNPINALNMSVGILSQDAPLSSHRQTEIVGIIKRQMEFLNRMVEDLHDAQQIEAGRLALKAKVSDARALVENVCELFGAISSIHRFNVIVPAGPVPIECDPIRLRQVLNNLVSNAIKYSPGGGDVSVVLERSDKGVVVQVSDSGLGIPPEELPHIFEPFRRTRLSKQEIPGTGLGLHVSRRIVEAHHGRIEVDSTLGKGTTFRVHLPTKAA